MQNVILSSGISYTILLKKQSLCLDIRHEKRIICTTRRHIIYNLVAWSCAGLSHAFSSPSLGGPPASNPVWDHQLMLFFLLINFVTIFSNIYMYWRHLIRGMVFSSSLQDRREVMSAKSETWDLIRGWLFIFNKAQGINNLRSLS